ncbi:hypothetical protein QBC35DRAFT_376583 [Podospora australis]|uniref:Plus3 domain-containing protein n=1 Tax=Podospora australis TaxID=1536484 RepID=A0AAN6WZL6_9PEZI|nr:hypothetical protein QBC35DRAFT_376583 [Podospora australis]
MSTATTEQLLTPRTMSSSPPGSPDSQMSAPMDESDSDSDAPQTQGRGGDDDTNQYPFEGLFRSAEEKSRIMNMREIEREQILAERREENERIRQNRMLRQLKVNQEKDSKKRKASAADLEDASRKSARARTKAGETSEKMDTLRRAREERTSRREQRERDLDRRKQRSPSYNDRGRSRSVDSRNSDGGDWRRDSRQKSRSPEIKEILPAELRDVERIRVGRSRFAEVCFYPGFEKAITGCYVRINIGPDPKNHQDVYRMAVIKGFSQGRPYALTDSTGHQMVVDLYVKAAHGKAEREWPFISCSDRSFTEAEWNRYKQVCLSEGLQVPTKQELVNKIDDINRLVRRQWTEQELSEKLKRQNTLMAKFSTVERDSVTKLLEQARARNDQEAIERLQTKLENLDTPRLAFRTSLTSAKKSEGKGLSQQERLAALNTKNRKYNAEEVRKAQLKERARTALAKEKAKEQMKNGGASSQGDNKDAAKETEASLLEHIAKLQEQQRSQAKSGVPMIHKPLMDDDIIGALDLDIDVDID